MEFRSLGASGLKVSVLSFGAMSFIGSAGQSVVGSTGVEEARRLVDRCLDAGINLFDTADVYSRGESEKVLGEALRGRRDRVDDHFVTPSRADADATLREFTLEGLEAARDALLGERQARHAPL